MGEVGRIKCADCGTELWSGPPEQLLNEQQKREQCPNCGSTRRGRVVELAGNLRAETKVDVGELKVTRGVNAIRLTLLALLLASGIAVGTATSWFWGVLTGVALAVMFGIPQVRHSLMSLLHRLSGQ